MQEMMEETNDLTGIARIPLDLFEAALKCVIGVPDRPYKKYELDSVDADVYRLRKCGEDCD
jgi:hypothetical protein